jgi:hypothetical protein
VLAGLLFAVYPGSVEAVAWTAGVFELSSTFLVLIAVHVWLLGRAKYRTGVILAILTIAAILSKESAVILPGLMGALLISLPTADRWARWRVASMGVSAIVSALTIAGRALWTEDVMGHARNWPSNRYEWKEMIVRPYSATFLPFRTDDGIWADVYLAALGIVVLLGLAAMSLVTTSRRECWAASSSRLVFVGLAWCGLAALPLLLQFYVATSMQGSRYLYLPAVGTCLVLAGATADRSRSRYVAGLALCVFAIVIGVFSARLYTERELWWQAATVRDVFLGTVTAAATEASCRSIMIRTPPDSVRGVYVFREGLQPALAAVPLTAHGRACEWTWIGDGLVDADPARDRHY